MREKEACGFLFNMNATSIQIHTHTHTQSHERTNAQHEKLGGGGGYKDIQMEKKNIFESLPRSRPLNHTPKRHTQTEKQIRHTAKILGDGWLSANTRKRIHTNTYTRQIFTREIIFCLLNGKKKLKFIFFLLVERNGSGTKKKRERWYTHDIYNQKLSSGCFVVSK